MKLNNVLINEEAKEQGYLSKYLSDFPHCSKSVEYGFQKGAEFILQNIIPKWIELKKEFPPQSEENLAYLVKWKDGDIWVSVWVNDTNSFIDDGVSHWMPLPNPPSL